MPASLDSPRGRLRNAERHLDTLRALEQKLGQDNPNPVSAKFDPNLGEEFIPVSMELLKVDLPEGVKEVVGDVIQNLQIPLDYLVYEIAWLDSGAIQNGTQFPVFWKRRDFRSYEPKYLAGVSDAHRYVIDLMQPYNRGKWLGTLKELALPDKHRTFLTVMNGANARLSGRAVPEADGKGWHPEVELEFTPTISFDKRRPAVETLEQLQAGVHATIEEFDPCFRGECPHVAPPEVRPAFAMPSESSCLSPVMG